MSETVGPKDEIIALVFRVLDASRDLADDLGRLPDMPTIVSSIKEDVSQVQKSVNEIRAIGDTEWSLMGPGILECVKVAIQKCETTCVSIRHNIGRWLEPFVGVTTSGGHHQSKTERCKRQQLNCIRLHLGVYVHTEKIILGFAAWVSQFHNLGETTERYKEIQSQRIAVNALGRHIQSAEIVIGRELDTVQRTTIDDADEDEDFETLQCAPASLEEIQKTIRILQDVREALAGKLHELKTTTVNDWMDKTTAMFTRGNSYVIWTNNLEAFSEHCQHWWET